MSSLVRLFLSSLAVLAVAVSLSGCSGDDDAKAAQQEPQAPQVTVSKPAKRLVADNDEYVGRFVAMDYVEVRARVSGYLDKIQFRDGQMVKKGEPLFTIDRRPFQASLDQTKAAVQQAEANLAFADSDLARGESLQRGTVISQQTLDQRTQAKRVAQANVAAQQAANRSAELDLQFTELTAPVSGRIGDRRVAPGNLVTGNTTLLATIASVDPIRFEFTMDEASYLRYTRAATNVTDSANRGLSLPVKLKLIDEKDFTHQGKIDFVDNTIDQSSGTIRGRAEFSNPDGRLTPGMFGRIQLALSAPAEALLVPDDAIATEQVKKFVYTVGADNVATPKYVTLGPLLDKMRVITAGLDANDTVVVNGLMRVRAGAKISPQFAPEAKTADNAPHHAAVTAN
jgi:RND family efflux transporter MFP subunit